MTRLLESPSLCWPPSTKGASSLLESFTIFSGPWRFILLVKKDWGKGGTMTSAFSMSISLAPLPHLAAGSHFPISTFFHFILMVQDLPVGFDNISISWSLQLRLPSSLPTPKPLPHSYLRSSRAPILTGFSVAWDQHCAGLWQEGWGPTVHWKRGEHGVNTWAM